MKTSAEVKHNAMHIAALLNHNTFMTWADLKASGLWDMSRSQGFKAMALLQFEHAVVSRFRNDGSKEYKLVGPLGFIKVGQ